ncbi:sensor histidine kinase [Gulosibacter hominis]|uniref:sensor histidine kinase n=1 Tax=Gulosibacter hominis TaxID=2770504 RepID=UPI00191B6E53|nr:HAMP domain-containing sensor histidine kinase [Gulosibacter hominis]
MAKRLPRWDHISMRNQLTLVNVALLMLSLVVAGIGTTLLLRPTLVNQVDSSLLAIAADPSLVVGTDLTTGRFGYDDIQTAPQPYYVALLDSDTGRLLVDNRSSNRGEAAPDVSGLVTLEHQPDGRTYTIFEVRDSLGSAWRTVTVFQPEYAADEVQGVLVVATPMSAVNATMASFLAIFSGFGLSVLIFAAALTRLLVSITLQPLRQVESTAMAFAAGDYEQRLPELTPNTEVGRLSRSLNTMLGRIDSAFDERDRTILQMRRFVGDASHELRTPLVTVRGYAELYRMGALSDDQKVGQAMDRIEGEAKRMAGLVEDLLQLARLDEHREMPKDVIDLEPIVDDAALDTNAQAPDRTVRVHPIRVFVAGDDFNAQQSAFGAPTTGAAAPDEPAPKSATVAAHAAERPQRKGAGRIRIPGLGRKRRTQPDEAAREAGTDQVTEQAPETTEYPGESDVPAMIYANSDKVRQAVQNIIGNALRYTPAGSPLELGIVLNVPDKQATVEIIDHGPGIPAETRKQIFQRFWRADTSRDRQTGGTGLGLAIVSAIMQAHDGTVDVVETPGGGATFRLHFPLLTAPPVESDASTE